ncbi:aspartic proteinase precursor [Dendryphion nanum]|uniref:Aspartic proteinase n=1 Tax=Dendryphion nanum TaxID=256645 RepID=A0A9P9EEL6_9PLEO|nr:aspartic proteinase precursor [Dendryphion nanum]
MSGSNLKRINVKPNPGYQKAGVQSYANLLKKYDFTPTTEGPFQKVDQQFQGVKKLLHPRKSKIPPKQLKIVEEDGKTGEIKAEDQQNDALYLCPVEIGTPPQVWSTDLDKSTQLAGASKHTIFNPKKSSTYKQSSGSTWKIKYGDGSTASGNVGTDHVTLGGLCIEGQAVELASKLSPQFMKGAGDGLLGLAFGKINTVKPKAVATPVENMIAQKDIPTEQELFTCYLGSWRDKEDIDKGESFFTFGYIDQDVIKRCGGVEPHYVPIDTSKGFWQFKSESAIVNGQTIKRPGNTAIADTGTTLALVDDITCKAIYGAIPGGKFEKKYQGWIFPVNTPENNLPKITFAVGDKQFEVQKEDFGFAKVDSEFQYGGIQSRGDSTFDILGDTWLKGIYAIFDQGRKRFGAVQRIEGTQNLSTAPPK